MAHDPKVYQRLELREQIYLRPGAHLGSDQHVRRRERLLVSGAFQSSTIDYPEAAERAYGEILSNAGDNVQRSREAGIDPGRVEVSMSDEWVVVRNGGLVVPVAINEKEGIYTPEMVFGVLLTSSNYDDKVDRTWGGCNGEGAKLCNIFSKVFSVRIGDPQRGLSYQQTWRDNMRERSDPVISKYHGPGYVEVAYLMDMERFGYKRYPPCAAQLYARRAADISFSCDVPVVFNGNELSCRKITGYAAMCFPVVHHFVHKEETPGCSVSLLVADAVDQGSVVSFMNGIESSEGGIHVEATYKKLREGISAHVDKPSKNGEKKKRLFVPKDLKAHVSIVVACRLYNPVAHSQSKTKAGDGKSTFRVTIPPAKIKAMLSWPFLRRLYELAELRDKGALRKTDGKGRRRVNVARTEDANYAGKPGKAGQCSLFVIEGKSAMAWAAKVVSRLPEGRNYCGLFPMKGVPLNVTNADYQQVAENKEIGDLKLTLGLREGVKYDDDKEFRTLRYGHFVIMTDADDDGIHIRGLVINVFHLFWPELLRRGFVKYLRTPIVKVTKGVDTVKFYSAKEYLDWQEATSAAGWKAKYFKGLACANNEDVADEVKDLHIVVCDYDDLAPSYLQLAFDKKLSDKRKVWIGHHHMEVEKTPPPVQPISNFVNDDLILHSLTNILRSIPRLDGLKRSQRQVLWASMKRWGEKKKDTMKVGRLAYYVAQHTGYHHGEKSLVDAINNMALDYAGSNNLPYFYQDGMFGTRNMEGKDVGQARYVAVKPKPWWKMVFRTEDICLYRSLVEEGEPREPIVFYPVIPLLLVNGANGIATAWSTFVPNHNPLDLCLWLRARIAGTPLPPVLPWYRGFTGTIELKERSAAIDQREKGEGSRSGKIVEPLPEDDILGPDAVFEEKAGWSMVVSGTFEKLPGRSKQGKIVVTELPLTRSIHSYETWLKKEREIGHIKDYNTMSTEDKPNFTIFGAKDPTIKSLRLQKSFGLDNMTYIDDDNRPKRAKDVASLLETWFLWRFPYYAKRKDLVIEAKEHTAKALSERMRFIDAIRSGKLVVVNRPESEVNAAMDAMGFDRALLKKTSLHGSLADSITRLEKEVAKLLAEVAELQATAPEKLWLSDIDEFIEAYRREYH